MASDFDGLGDVPDHLAFDVDGLIKGAGDHVPGLKNGIEVKNFKG